jgi:hypothetical protein
LRVSRTIDRPIVEAAIRIGRDYLMPHTRAAFGLMDADERVADARRILRWLGNSVNSVNCVNGVRVVSKRSVHANILGSRYSVEEVESVISLLLRLGYFRHHPMEDKSGPGRKASPIYEIHPSVFI